MTRREYMQKLADCLAELPAQERQDALNYYEEYFDAAGPEAEEQTIRELGEPETVARTIRESSAAEPQRNPAPAADAPQPDETHYGYTPEPPRKGPAAFWAGLSVPGRVLLVVLSVLAVISVCFQVITMFGLSFDSTASDIAFSVEASDTLDTARPGSGDASVVTEITITEENDAVAEQSGTAAQEAVDSWAAEGGEWSVQLSDYRKMEITINSGEFIVMIDGSMPYPTLIGDGISQSAVRITEKEKKLTIQAPVSTQENTGDGTLILHLPSEGYLEELELTLNSTAAADTIAELPALSLKELDVEVNGGALILSDAIAVEKKAELSVNDSAGFVDGGSLDAREAELSAGAGSITFGTLRCTESADLESKTGSIAISELSIGKELDLECSGGEIYVAVQGRAEQYAFESSCKYGTLWYDYEDYSDLSKSERNKGAAMRIEAECNDGTVEIVFLG